MKKWMYELIYRFPFVPMSWIYGSHTAFLEQLLVDEGITPGRFLDLGCGDGSNASIFLAQQGFDVIGVDFSPTAIKRARKNAKLANVNVCFLEDDLTNLTHVNGDFDLLVDFGALNDLSMEARDLYIQNVIPLTRTGSLLILMCFENNLPSEEVFLRFGDAFKIKLIERRLENIFKREQVFYLMKRMVV